MEDYNLSSSNNAQYFEEVSDHLWLTLKDQEMEKDGESDLNPTKAFFISDIFDCIVGKHSSSQSSVYQQDDSYSTKHHIRQLAIEKRKEIAKNLLKTGDGIKVVNAIKARIAFYMVSNYIMFTLLQTLQNYFDW